jgi:hypothetical protein
MAQEARERMEAGTVELKLPKLQIRICQGDNLIRTVDVDDPRETMCNTLREFGYEATPVA